MRRIRGDTARAATLLGLHAAALIAFIVAPLERVINPDSVSRFVERVGWYGPAALLFLCATTPLLMIPRWILAAAGGMLYGTLVGGALANVGSSAGAVVGMLFARYMARDFVVRRLGQHREAFDRMTARHGVWALIALRAFPFSNFILTNMLAGVSNIRLLPYAAASFVGMIPSSFLYAFMGKVAKRPERGLLVLFGLVFVAFSVLTLTVGRRVLGRFGGGISAPSPKRSAGTDGKQPPPPATGNGRQPSKGGPRRTDGFTSSQGPGQGR